MRLRPRIIHSSPTAPHHLSPTESRHLGRRCSIAGVNSDRWARSVIPARGFLPFGGRWCFFLGVCVQVRPLSSGFALLASLRASLVRFLATAVRGSGGSTAPAGLLAAIFSH